MQIEVNIFQPKGSVLQTKYHQPQCIPIKVLLSRVKRRWFDRYHDPHILVNQKGGVTWKVCLSSIDLKNEHHGNLNFVGSTVRGRTRWGGSTSPALPFREIAPEVKRSKNALLTKYANNWHDQFFLNCLDGGWSKQYVFPLKLPKEHWKYFKIDFCPFQNLSGWRIAIYNLPLIVVIVTFSSTKTRRVSTP